MMRKIVFILMLLPFFGFCQNQSLGNLTIFSEDGDKFFLVLNGEKQNDVAQTNIKIEELPQPYYSTKIIFENTAIAPISKNNLMLTDAEGNMMDVTYKIRKDKSNKAKLSYYSMIPVPQDFTPPSGMYVRQFGQPPLVTGGIKQPNNTVGIGASLNAPGLNVNISISDPGEINTSSHSSTQTNTQTTTTQQNQYPVRGCKNAFPMNTADFNAALNTIKSSSFEETKLKTANSIVASNCVSVDQVVQICNLFSFEESKLNFAKYAFKYTTDNKNYFKVNNVFSFSASKEELSEFTEKNN